jgi:hypothetical protein
VQGLYPVFLAGVVTIVGWYATYAYAKRREDRTRRLEIQLKYRQRQIEELYGPLLSLVEQIFNVWQVRRNILTAPGNSLSSKQVQIVREFFWERYFAPLHSEIAALLKTKLYLLEGGLMPDSFARYLEHATQEACQHRLWNEHQIDTKHVPGRPWPEGFYEDVKDTLGRLMERHQTGVEELSFGKDRKPLATT